MDQLNIAYCGLYCEECNKYKKKKCTGCLTNTKASWCEIRKCCIENNYSSCAECNKKPLEECKKYNNFFAKIISFFSRTQRSKCIEKIKLIGYENFAKEMKLTKRKSIKIK